VRGRQLCLWSKAQAKSAKTGEETLEKNKTLGFSDSGGASGFQPQSAPQFLLEGFVACPYCNRDNQIQFVRLYTAIDEKVFIDSELPNTYVVSILKCKSCGLKFDLPRVDVRFGLKRGE